MLFEDHLALGAAEKLQRAAKIPPKPLGI